jgi:hypothetical protein
LFLNWFTIVTTIWADFIVFIVAKIEWVHLYYPIV